MHPAARPAAPCPDFHSGQGKPGLHPPAPTPTGALRPAGMWRARPAGVTIPYNWNMVYSNLFVILLAYVLGMAKRHTLPQLKKYDVNQKVIEALADAESRAILFSTVRKGKSAAELSEGLRIPLSSVYKKLADLEDLTLIRVEKWLLSDKGRKYKIYKSRISRADISMRRPEPTIGLTPN